MEKLIKQSNEEKDKKKKLLDNKTGIIIAVVIIVVFGIAAFFLKGGTSVKVATGINPQEVEKSLERTAEPLYQQQKQIKKEQEELKKELKSLSSTLENLNRTLEKIGKKEEKQRIPKEKIEQILGLPKTKQSQKAFEINPIEENPLKHKTISEPSKPINVKKQLLSISQMKQEKKRKKPTVYIPAGSIAFGRLMYGFTAPERGIFPPVIIEFSKALSTANDFYIPLQKCRITTKAQYNLSQGLAVLGGKGSKMSCVLKNGKVVEVAVNIAVGEEIKDGKVNIGLSGEEKWLTGKELATLGVLTTGTGMAEAYQQANTVQSFTPQGNVITSVKNSLGYGLAGGVSSTLNKFAEFWFKKFDNKYPAIQVEPKTKVFVMFINGVDLGIEEKEL